MRAPITVRRIPFELADDLEPYLIESVRVGLDRIDDPELKAEAGAYCAQEGQHYRQRRRSNELLGAYDRGDGSVPILDTADLDAFRADGTRGVGGVAAEPTG